MLTEHGPVGEFGPFIVFRREDTQEFLWRSCMPRPFKGDLVGNLEGEDEVAVWYKVESVLYEFDHERGVAPPIGGGDPEPFEADNEAFGICVFVSEVP